MNFDFEAYRRQVEAIRDEGGHLWLSMLNQRQQVRRYVGSGVNSPNRDKVQHKVC